MIDKKRDTCIDDYDDVVINNQLSILDRAVIILLEWTFAFILIVSRAPVVLFEKPRNGRGLITRIIVSQNFRCVAGTVSSSVLVQVL